MNEFEAVTNLANGPIIFTYDDESEASRSSLQYEWKLRWLPSPKDNAHVYIHKKKKMRNVFIYKKPDTFQKARQSPLRLYTKSHTLDVMGFSWNFWSWHLYTKSMTLCVTWSLYIQKARHFAKSKTMCDTFLYTVLLISTARLEHNTYIWLVR